MLVGRQAELRELEALLDRTGSRGASIVVHGAAGQGKSSLLRWVADAARRRGCQVLEATGIEFERELPYSGLTGLLRPFHSQLRSLPPAQRDALGVALGTASGDASAFHVWTATLDLLSLAAGTSPIVIVVDDAQWVDEGTLGVLAFTALRAGADPIGFVFAQRAGLPCLLDGTAFPRLELDELDRHDALALFEAQGAAPSVAERCWTLTGGNPLAIVEGARGLTAGQRSGRDPLPAALPAASRILAAYHRRLQALPAATVQALGLAALDPGDDLVVIVAALERVGLSAADLEVAERDEVVEFAGNCLRWRHPLLRSAAHARISGEWRRRAHRALAAAQQSAGHDDVALWHLSESVLGKDQEVAAQMEDFGGAARRRGALAAAAKAYEQAERLATDAAAGDRCVLAAAEARWAAGDLAGTAGGLVDRIATVENATVAARMAIVLGQAEMWTRGAAAGVQRFERHAAAVVEPDPDLAVFLLLHAVTGRMLELDPDAVAAAERAVALSGRSSDPAVLFGASAMHNLARFFRGDGGVSTDDLEPLHQVVLAALSQGVADDLAQLCAYAMVAGERWGEATALLRQVVALSESSGVVGRSAFARLLLAEVLWRTGRWADSVSETTQSMSLLDAVRPGYVMPGTLAVLARLEAGLGREDSCRAHVDQVVGRPPQIEMFTVIAQSAVGLLELGAGRARAAATAFDDIVDRAAAVGEPGWLWWHADAVEAYAGCGRTDDAQRVLQDLQDQTAATGRGWATAAAARSRGLLDPTSNADAAFTTALKGFRTLGAPFEEARTLFVRGHRRVRAGLQEPGGRDLAAARTIFDRLGARAWSERASAVRGEVAGSDDALTTRLSPAELRVALAVGHGASNREAAEQLYISVKTVEYHLQSIYRKLGLRSRSQLVTLVVTDTRG